MAFPHKVHTPLKLACTSCHATATGGERAGLPQGERCAACHPQREFALPQRSIAHLKDFVVFSHARHASAKLECAECHGDTAKLNAPVKNLSMKSCVDCHRSRRTTVQCNVCHELSQ